MSFIADRVVMDGLTFDDVLLIPATFRATASKFSKVVICIRSFLQILYHSSITSETGRFYHVIENQCIAFFCF